MIKRFIAHAVVVTICVATAQPGLAQFGAPQRCEGSGCASSMRTCSQQEINDILKPAEHSLDSVAVKCSATLSPNDVVTRRLDFGPESSGTTFDCNGATIANPKTGEQRSDTYRIMVRSLVDGRTGLARTARDIAITNCRVHGAIQIGSNVSLDKWRTSSFEIGHTKRMQEWSSTNITFDNLTIDAKPLADGKMIGNVLYVSPGASSVTLQNSRMTGRIANGVPIYFDAESQGNVVRNNVIAVQTDGREQLAIDGSSDNLIEKNTFLDPSNGAIYVYRNCGENGIVRHLEPRRNVIRSNTFRFEVQPKVRRNLIWIASREKGTRFKSWCRLDDGHAFGSSASDSDFARDNQITANTFINVARDKAVSIDDPGNIERGSIHSRRGAAVFGRRN